MSKIDEPPTRLAFNGAFPSVRPLFEVGLHWLLPGEWYASQRAVRGWWYDYQYEKPKPKRRNAMPWKPPRNKPLNNQPREDRRVSPAKRGLDRKHRKMREQELKDQPLCVLCLEKGLVVAAEHIDHIKPLALGGDPHEPTNRRPTCATCNTSAGARVRRPRHSTGVEIEADDVSQPPVQGGG